MKLKEYSDPASIADAIKDKIFTYQYVMNQASKMKSNSYEEDNIYKQACKIYSKRKKKAIADLLKEW